MRGIYEIKYNRMQLTVTSKVKAGQYNELQKLLQANSRPSEAELKRGILQLRYSFPAAVSGFL